MKLLVIDTESGGLDAAKHSLLSIALVVWEDGRIIDSTQVFINEGEFHVTPEAMAINRIDLVQLQAKAVSPKYAVKFMWDFLSPHFKYSKIEIAAHNASFDIAFLKRLYMFAHGNLQEYNTMYSYRVCDTVSLAYGLKLAGKLPLQKLNLESLCQHYNVVNEQAHDALADATATAHVLTKMVDEIRGYSI